MSRRAPLIAAVVGAVLGTLVTIELVLRATVTPVRLPPVPDARALDPYEANPFIVQARPFLQTFVPGARYTATRAGYAVDYAINAHGFRGPEVGVRMAPRLVVVGDSIAEGHGVPFERAIPALLGEADARDGWEVVSAAMQGGSPLYYAANLPRYLTLAPDAVLLLLYENDLWDDRGREAVYADLPLIDDDASSALALMARRAWRNLVPTPLERRIASNRGAPPSTVLDERFPWIRSADDVAREFRASSAYLDLFADQLAARDIRLLVSFVAIGTLVPHGSPAFLQHARALEHAVDDWATGRGLPYLSLLAEVEQSFTRGDPVMIAGDGHPTRDMQQRLAAALLPWLRANLPPSTAAAARNEAAGSVAAR